MKTRRNLVRVSAAAATTAAILGGAILAAPTASAASLPKSCTWEWAWPQRMEATSDVNLRSGPGTKYASLGILFKGARFTEYCDKDHDWSYGKVTSGPNNGKWGWVKSDYVGWN
ncbi:SH3 domain-containing protein [Streptomyces muensis]|uniref:SH3 domain-containing protein n=1 Tax=Streptomyces muensis TaxID=1077944 RepID=A0A9X1PTN3_STRM4|nr:SH3 domain-containing protein [Streptomyces muensis]MCF1593385.1 SH3 domain-containing protein [Streptomyces muensis]